MPKALMLWRYLQEMVRAFRIIAFEKTDAVVLGLMLALALPLLLMLLQLSTLDAAIGAAAAGVCFYWVRRWGRANRFRLIRTADRVEYAVADMDENDYKQRFVTGVVLHRMENEEAEHSSTYSELLMAQSRHFFLVQSPEATRVVPFEWVVGIEIGDEGERN
jgi:hypothetical protein